MRAGKNDDDDDGLPAASVADFAIGTRVHVNRGGGEEFCGTIVEDFGDDAGYGVTIGDTLLGPSRRWAIALDDGNLAFLDSADLRRI